MADFTSDFPLKSCCCQLKKLRGIECTKKKSVQKVSVLYNIYDMVQKVSLSKNVKYYLKKDSSY